MSAPSASPATPLSLLQRLRQPEDAVAWEWFVQLYTPLLFYWARRAGLQEADAADLVQEVFAVLVRKLPEFRYEAGGSFRGWLRTVLTNKWRELNRRQPPPTQAGIPLDQLPSPATEALDGPSYQEELIHQALHLLRPDFRPATWEAFWRTAVLGRPTRAVAADLGVSVNVVLVSKYRVVNRLRQEIEGLLG